jgi:hypothetical protein
MGTALVSTNTYMAKENVIYMYITHIYMLCIHIFFYICIYIHRILLTLKIKENSAICNTIGEPIGHYKWKKPNEKKTVMYDLTYVLSITIVKLLWVEWLLPGDRDGEMGRDWSKGKKFYLNQGITSGDLLYNMETIGTNNILYICKLL